MNPQDAAEQVTIGGKRPTARIWFIGMALFAGFLLFEQDLRTSTYEDFVPAAEIREQWSAGGSLTRQIAVLGLGALGAVCLLAPGGQRIRIADPLMLIISVYLSYVVASYAWSIDPDATKRRLIVLGLIIVAAVGIGRQISARFIPELTMLCMLGYLVLGITCEVALGTFRPWSGAHRFAGTTHPNIQASYLVAMCLAAWAVHKQPGPLRPVALFVLVLGIVFLYLTRSRTSAGGLFLAFVFTNCVVADRFRAFKFGFAATWGICVISILTFGLGINFANSAQDLLRMGRREAAVEEAGSLTGRLPLWEELWTYVQAKPTFGYGYEAFWTADHFVAVASEIDWAPTTAHNSYLECLLDLGYIGLAIMVTAMLLIFWRLMIAAARTRQPHQQYVFALFVFTLTYGLTESGIRSPSAITFFLTLGLVANLICRPTSDEGTSRCSQIASTSRLSDLPSCC